MWKNVWLYSIKLSLLLVLVHGSTELHAQSSQDSVKELSEVIIFPNSQRFGFVSPTPVQSLTGERLRKLNSLSVADAIRYFSGVQLKDYGGVGGLKTVNIRSMGTLHTGVFLDGMSIGNAQNGAVDLGKFSLENIEAIELYHGHNSQQLQPAKAYFASSTIYLKTQRPKFKEEEKTRWRAAVKSGSFGLINPSVLWKQKLNKTSFLSANVEYLQAHGRYKFRYYKKGGYDSTYIRQNAGIEALRAEVAIFKEFTGGEAFVKTYFYSSERGLPGAVIANNPKRSQRLWDENFFIHGSFQKKYKNYEVLVNGKYSNDFTRYQDKTYKYLGVNFDTLFLNNRYRQHEVYLSLAQKIKIRDWWNVALSTDVSYHSLDANLYRFAYPRRYAYVGALSNHFTWDRFNLQTALLYSYYDEQVKYYKGSGDRKATSPMIGISWQPLAGKPLRLRSFYKESLRMPTFNDLYYTLIGNTRLEPEYTKQLDFGFTWLNSNRVLDQISVQADGYYNEVRNKIIAVPSANLFRWMMINQGKVEIAGVDVNVNLNKRLLDSLVVNTGISYTYQKAVNKTAGASSYDHQIPYVPVHSGTLHGDLGWREWSVNFSFIYTGERYMLPENLAKNYLQPWYTTDVGMNWNKRLGKYRYRLGMEVNNLLNQYYDVVINYPMPGRNFRFSIIVNN